MSSNFEILGRRLAAVTHDLVLHLLAFIERAQTSALHRGDVDEDIPAAATLGLNEAVTLRRIEPFHCAFCHHGLLRKCTQRAGERESIARVTNPNSASLCWRAHEGRATSKQC